MEMTKFSQIPEKSRVYSLFNEELSNNDLIFSINNLKLKDNYNIAKLIKNYKLTQSQYIKIGNELEKVIKRVIQNLGVNVLPIAHLLNIEADGVKKKTQIDLVFIIGNYVHYFEIKTNLNLDSEKTPATYKKIKLVVKELEKIYPNHNVYGKLLSTWFSKNDVPNNKKKNVFFIEELFELIGEPMTKEEYYDMLANFGSKLVSNRI